MARSARPRSSETARPAAPGSGWQTGRQQAAGRSALEVAMRLGATLGAAEPGAAEPGAAEPGGAVPAAGQPRDRRRREQAGLADHGTRRASHGTHQREAP